MGTSYSNSCRSASCIQCSTKINESLGGDEGHSVRVCTTHPIVRKQIFLTFFSVSHRRDNSYLVEHSPRQMRNEWQVPALWFNLWYFMMELKYFRLKGDTKRTKGFLFVPHTVRLSADVSACLFLFCSSFFFFSFPLLYLPTTQINKQTTRKRARYLIFIYYVFVCV